MGSPIHLLLFLPHTDSPRSICGQEDEGDQEQYLVPGYAQHVPGTVHSS